MKEFRTRVPIVVDVVIYAEDEAEATKMLETALYPEPGTQLDLNEWVDGGEDIVDVSFTGDFWFDDVIVEELELVEMGDVE